MATRARKSPTGKPANFIEEDGEQVLENIKGKYDNNKKIINGAITAILVIAGATIGYFKLYKEPRENKGLTVLNSAQQLVAIDSLDRALNGDGVSPGFLKIIDKYSGTKAENLARYYAGMIYLKQGNFKNAISNLEKFDGDETIFETAANGALGDAYLESGNMEKALDRSEEHTSELQSRENLVCRLLLE